MKVNFFSEKNKAKKISKTIKNMLDKTLSSGQYTNGNYVNKFELKFKNYLGAKYCVAVNSGTSALHLSLIAFNSLTCFF